MPERTVSTDPAKCQHVVATFDRQDGSPVEAIRCGSSDPDHRHTHWIEVPCDC